MTTHQQILKDSQGNEIGVFLPIQDYKALMEMLEEQEDIEDYKLAMDKNEETIPLREAIELRKNHNA